MIKPIRFPELCIQFMDFFSEFGLTLLLQIFKFAGLPTVIASYLVTMPATPFNEEIIITRAVIGFQGHAALIIAIVIFTFMAIILACNTSAIYTLHCLEHGEQPSNTWMNHTLLKSFHKASALFLLMTFSAIAGLMLCILPGIYVLSAGSVMPAILHKEEVTVFRALQGGIQSMRGHILKPIAFALLVFFGASIVITGLDMFLGMACSMLSIECNRIISMIGHCLQISALAIIPSFGAMLFWQVRLNQTTHASNAPNN